MIVLAYVWRDRCFPKRGMVRTANLCKFIMRITLCIDDDVLAIVRCLAKREGKGVGEMLSTLARKGLSRPSGAVPKRNGIPLLSTNRDTRTVTSDLVNTIRNELA